MIKYLVFPREVESKNDGDYHYISCDMLIHLYGVNPKECKCIRSERDLRGYNTDNYISLYPRYNGDYKEWLEWALKNNQ